jgi:hypothetical protein
VSILPQHRWGKSGVVVWYCWHWVIYLAPITPMVGGGPDGNNVSAPTSLHVGMVDGYKDNTSSTWDGGKAQLLDSPNK